MGAIQDALTGFPLTAGARILEAILATAGVIAGVSGGITVGRMLGVDLGRLDPGFTSFSDLPVMAIGAAITAARLRVRCLRAAAQPARPIALIAGVAEVVFYTTFRPRPRGRLVLGDGRGADRSGGLRRRRPGPRPAAGDRGVLDRAAAARPVDLPRAVPALRGRQRPAVDDQRGRDRHRAGGRRDLRRVRRPAAQARGPPPREPAVRPPAGRPAAGPHRPAPHGAPRPTRASGPRSPPTPAAARRGRRPARPRACRGPWCTHATRRSTPPPSPRGAPGRSRRQRSTPSRAHPAARASSWHESRKNTPCTRPCTTASTATTSLTNPPGRPAGRCRAPRTRPAAALRRTAAGRS